MASKIIKKADTNVPVLDKRAVAQSLVDVEREMAELKAKSDTYRNQLIDLLEPGEGIECNGGIVTSEVQEVAIKDEAKLKAAGIWESVTKTEIRVDTKLVKAASKDHPEVVETVARIVVRKS